MLSAAPNMNFTYAVCAAVRIRHCVGKLLALATFAIGAISNLSVAHAAMTVEGYTTATAGQYDRFLNDPAYIGNPANWPAGVPATITQNPWTGVGRGTAGNWGTVVSPSYIISANHFPPSGTIRFYYTNDPNSGYEDRTIVAVQHITGGDVWLGQLDTPVSSNVAISPFLLLPHNSDYAGLGIYTFGLSDAPEGVDPVYGNDTMVRLGTNQIDLTAPYDNGNPNTIQQLNVSGTVGFAFPYSYNPTIPNPSNPSQSIEQPNESFLNAGDSGGPSFFLYSGGAPAVVGLHWFNNPDTPLYSGDTYLQKYINGIQSAMVGETLTTISPVLGDLNFDGAVTTADVPAMLSALTNLATFKLLHGLSSGYLLDIADMNGDGAVTNADIAGLLAHFTMVTGTGSVSFGPQAVPEPATAMLTIAGFLSVLLFGFFIRRRKSRLRCADLAQ